MSKRFIVYVIPVALAACGGGGGGTSSTPAPVATATPTPAPTVAATPSPSPSASPSASPTATPTFGPASPTVSFAAGTAAAFSTQPDIPNCRAGTLNSSVAANVVTMLNQIRALHRLPAITLSSSDNPASMEAALMMAANGQLSHTPPTSWKCYTALGAAGANQSNLYGALPFANLNYGSDESLLAGWLTEIDNISVDSVGHRRWLLNPFLVTIGYGRVAGTLADGRRSDAAALKVINNAGQNVVPTSLPPFVAYPYGDYPAKYFDTRSVLSFTVVTDGSSAFGANRSVDFSRATVTVTGPGGAMTVSSVAYDNDGYGVANNIQWKVAGLQVGTSYSVAINGVVVRGASTNYSYTFRILN